MEKDLKTLLEKVVLSEDTKEALIEAWTTKVGEVREEVAAELREEFSSRFEHDKGVVVEAMEKFITDRLAKETAGLIDGQKKLAEERAALTKKGGSISEKFEKFMTAKLVGELKEFASERGIVSEKIAKTEKFIVSKLAEELKEYEDSKAQLISERVAVEVEKNKQIADAKKSFVEKASSLAEKVISEGLKAEFSQLREELAEARKLTFGRKIFESYMAEYAANFFNESEEVKKISSKIGELEGALSEAKKSIEAKDAELSEAKKEVRITKELVERKEVLSDILSPLNKEKRAIMGKLLESVETRKLRDSYNKFLPSVLGVHETGVKQTLTENTSRDEGASHEGKRVVDGNRKALEEKEAAEIVELRNLTRQVKHS
jgi:hypothetical protein